MAYDTTRGYSVQTRSYIRNTQTYKASVIAETVRDEMEARKRYAEAQAKEAAKAVAVDPDKVQRTRNAIKDTVRNAM